MVIARSTLIERPIESVFEFVRDPRNDVQWCPKVRSVVQVGGEGPGPGARYAVVHRPIPLRPARAMAYSCVDWRPPYSIEWREDDGHDTITVTYQLEEAGSATRFTQRDEADLSAPKLIQPLMRAGIGRDIAAQLRALKRRLEGSGL